MTAPQHGNICDGSQSVMYDVLSGSSTVTALTTNIYDGDPHKIASRVGVPFIVIAPPMLTRIPITQTKWESNVVISLTYRTKSESVLRKLSDAIETAIIEAENTFIDNNMYDPEFNQGTIDNDIVAVAGGKPKIVYGLSRDITFQVNSSYI